MQIASYSQTESLPQLYFSLKHYCKLSKQGFKFQDKIENIYQTFLICIEELKAQPKLMAKVQKYIRTNPLHFENLFLKVSSENHACHLEKITWSCHSEYFQAMLQGSFQEKYSQELVLDDLSLETVELINLHLNDSTCNIFQKASCAELVQIYQFADQFRMDEIKNIAEVYLKNWIYQIFNQDESQLNHFADILSCRVIMSNSLIKEVLHQFEKRGISIDLQNNSFTFIKHKLKTFLTFIDSWQNLLKDFKITKFYFSGGYYDELSRFLVQWKRSTSEKICFENAYTVRFESYEEMKSQELAQFFQISSEITDFEINSSYRPISQTYLAKIFAKLSHLTALTIWTFREDYALQIPSLLHLKNLRIAFLQETVPSRLTKIAKFTFSKLFTQTEKKFDFCSFIKKFPSLEILRWPKNLAFDLETLSLPPSVKTLELYPDAVKNINSLQAFFDRNIFIENILVIQGYLEIDDQKFHVSTIPGYFKNFVRTLDEERNRFESTLQIIKPFKN